jgi:hypothetical protein
MIRNTTPESTHRLSIICHHYCGLVCLKVDVNTFVGDLATACCNRLRKIPYTFALDIGVRGKMACSSGVRYRVWSSRHVQENLLLAYLSRHFVEYSDTFHRTPIKASPQCEASLAQAVDLYSRGKSPGSFVHSRIIPRSSPASDSYLVEPLQHLHGSAGTSRPAQHVSDTGSIATEVLFATCWLVKPSE